MEKKKKVILPKGFLPTACLFCLFISIVIFMISSSTISSFAQDYPTKPVRVIVAFSAGSATDGIARLVSQKLSDLWGQPVVVENHAGGGGTVGAGVVAKSSPDGYTLLMTSAAYATSPAVYRNLPYDPVKDFVDIAPLIIQPNVLVVGPSAGVRTVTELIVKAKARPGEIKFGSAGTGSASHFIAEKFRLAMGIDVVHVPYKVVPQLNTDTMAGRVTYWFPPLAIALPHIREGKILALAVRNARRSSLLPEVPTLAETGVAGFADGEWYGVWAPAGTPAGIVGKLAKDVAGALAAPDMREKLAKLGVEPMSMSPTEFSSFVRDEMESASRIAKEAGIEPQ
jgi:tripartite-type tricarboxylate transporter receptor subunit TctC